MNLNRLRTAANSLIERHRALRQLLREESGELKLAKQQAKIAEQGQQVVQSLALEIQTNVHRQISGVVVRCMDAIFPDPASFEIKFDRKRGRTEAVPSILVDGQKISPVKNSGKGRADIAALAMRLACLKLSNPQLRMCVFLDEPFLGIGENLRESVADLILQLSKELGIQFVIITHQREFRVGKVIDLSDLRHQVGE